MYIFVVLSMFSILELPVLKYPAL